MYKDREARRGKHRHRTESTNSVTRSVSRLAYRLPLNAIKTKVYKDFMRICKEKPDGGEVGVVYMSGSVFEGGWGLAMCVRVCVCI